MKKAEIGKSYIRPSFAVAALVIVFVLHFVFTQFVALQSENEAVLSEIINQPPAGATPLKTATEAEKPGVDAGLPQQQPVSVSPIVKIEKPEQENKGRVIATRQTVEIKPTATPALKKKEARDARSERLRRAERILTGI